MNQTGVASTGSRRAAARKRCSPVIGAIDMVNGLELLKGRAGCVEDRVDLGVGVREAGEPGFELRWWQEHTAFEHCPEEASVRGAVRAKCLRTGAWRHGQEEESQERPTTSDGHGSAGSMPRFSEAQLESVDAGVQRVVALVHELVERRDPGGHRQRMAGECPSLVDSPERRDEIHQLASAAVRADGMPPPMILPRVVRSGVTPNIACAPPRPTRKPVITSSKTSSAPWRSVTWRSCSRKPGVGAMTPAL